MAENARELAHLTSCEAALCAESLRARLDIVRQMGELALKRSNDKVEELGDEAQELAGQIATRAAELQTRATELGRRAADIA